MATTTGSHVHPGIRSTSLIFHIGKTLALVTSLLHDARVHWFSKMVFLGSLGTLLLALLFPESMVDLLGFFGLPGLGALLNLVGIPAEATLDWVALSVAAFNLLKLFPAEIVGEHYDRLFRK